MRFVLLAAVLVLAPACVTRSERSDSVRSIRFAAHTVADRAVDDARATRDHVAGAGEALCDEWNSSLESIAETWRLYSTGATR